jgi:predicted nucleotidyltransferase
MLAQHVKLLRRELHLPIVVGLHAGSYTAPVNAKSLLGEIGRALAAVRLEAILIGNAGAALQGAPVTTIDFDFMFRKTPRNLQKMKALARILDSVVMTPFYPAAELYRVMRDDGLQVDFMTRIHGIRSFEGLRDRSTTLAIDGTTVRVASLADIIKSKKAARRPRDLAVVELLEQALEEDNRRQARKTRGTQKGK